VLTVSLQSGGSLDDRLSTLDAGTSAGKIDLNDSQVLYGGVSRGIVTGGLTDLRRPDCHPQLGRDPTNRRGSVEEQGFPRTFVREDMIPTIHGRVRPP